MRGDCPSHRRAPDRVRQQVAQRPPNLEVIAGNRIIARSGESNALILRKRIVELEEAPEFGSKIDTLNASQQE